MSSVLEVIQSPVVSEKSNAQRDAHNKYTFKVELAANKGAIKKAIEKVYGVNVTSITTTITRGKTRRRGMNVSLETRYKKATVTLKPDQKIPIFEDN